MGAIAMHTAPPLSPASSQAPCCTRPLDSIILVIILGRYFRGYCACRSDGSAELASAGVSRELLVASPARTALISACMGTRVSIRGAPPRKDRS